MAFVQFAPEPVWDLLVKVVNRNLAENNTSNTPQDSRRRDTNMGELLRFYGIQMAMENTYGNNTKRQRQHFAQLKRDLGPLFPQMGIDRYSALMSAFTPTPEELKEIADMISARFKAHVVEGTVSELSSYFF